MPERRDRDTTPLVSAPVEAWLTVRRILFDSLRELCEDLEMPEGARVRFRGRTPGLLLLQTGSGRIVALDAEWGRFIEVETGAEERTSGDGPQRPSEGRRYADRGTAPRADAPESGAASRTRRGRSPGRRPAQRES